MAQIHAATKSQTSAWNSANSCQITKILTRLISVLSLSRKIIHDHYCCPISAIMLTTSKLEAILKIWRGSWKLSKMGWDCVWGGGGPLAGTSPPAHAAGAQVASGYMPGDTLSGCCSSVSSSHSTFLCIAASWAVVDKNIHTIGAKHVWLFVGLSKLHGLFYNFLGAPLICYRSKYISSGKCPQKLAYNV